VLLAGGYLVLDPAFSGLVVATDARFYTLIRPGQHSTTTGPYKIVVRSPQFNNATWTYWITLQGASIDFSPRYVSLVCPGICFSLSFAYIL
jgi:phosphomevalonate kinase